MRKVCNGAVLSAGHLQNFGEQGPQGGKRATQNQAQNPGPVPPPAALHCRSNTATVKISLDFSENGSRFFRKTTVFLNIFQKNHRFLKHFSEKPPFSETVLDFSENAILQTCSPLCLLPLIDHQNLEA